MGVVEAQPLLVVEGAPPGLLEGRGPAGALPGLAPEVVVLAGVRELCEAVAVIAGACAAARAA